MRHKYLFNTKTRLNPQLRARYNMPMMTVCNVIAALTFCLMPSGATLYNAALEPIADLPAGYFVLKADDDAPPEGYLSVVYDDLRGYVELNEITAVDYIPVTKYETTARFRCDNDGQPVNLRAAPRRSAEILKTLSPDTSGRVYGTAQGDSLIKDGDTLWYYVDCDGVRGYCYYAHINADEFPPNIIEKEPTPQKPTQPEQKTENTSDKTLPRAAVIVLIVALCVPVPFIMFYLFRKPKT